MLNSDEWTGSNSVYLAGWRGTQQLTLFVSKLEAQALSHKVIGTKVEEQDDAGNAAAASEVKVEVTAAVTAEVKAEVKAEVEAEVEAEVKEQGTEPEAAEPKAEAGSQ